MPSKNLTPEQKADAERLRQAFLAKKDKTGLTQIELAEKCGWETQSSVSQYLRGKIPLNIDALTMMCLHIDADPAAISPTLVKQAQARALGATGRYPTPQDSLAMPPMAAQPTPKPIHSLQARKESRRIALLPTDVWESLEALDSAQLKSAVSVLRAHLEAVAPARNKRRKA